MKRSELVKYMCNEYGLSHRGGMSEMSEEERMEHLLSRLEAAGMLPPVREKTVEEHTVHTLDTWNEIAAWDKEEA